MNFKRSTLQNLRSHVQLCYMSDLNLQRKHMNDLFIMPPILEVQMINNGFLDAMNLLRYNHNTYHIVANLLILTIKPFK
jgi:hypothetical protein